MNRFVFAVVIVFGACLITSCSDRKTDATKPVAPTTISRQVHEQKDRWSPHETISSVIDGNRITITYGRPFRDDPVTHEVRPVWGGPHALVPFDKIWRFGADEATLFVTQKSIALGQVVIPPGAYSLFMILQANGEGVLVVNREIGQWGIDPYRSDRELARIPLTKEAVSPPVDQFTINVDRGSETGGILRISWDTEQFSVSFRVVETHDGAGGPRSAPAGDRSTAASF